MNKALSDFAARLRQAFLVGDDVRSLASDKIQNEPPHVGGCEIFNSLALELFSLQFKNNSAYRKICEARNLTPQIVEHWTRIPFVPTSAFKELELTSLAPDERIAVFHSSGTTEQKPSRHFHCAESLELYETSLWKWFVGNCRLPIADCRLICLTPEPKQTPNSSLVHMFETIRQKSGGTSAAANRNFFGKISADGWTLDFEAVLAALNSAIANRQPAILLGTAFSFVHLLDFLEEQNLKIQLPKNSFVMETGGYKNRSRSMPKAELHSLIEKFLGVPRENIICEYGMSELSSQAYDSGASAFRRRDFSDSKSELAGGTPALPGFQFPLWARAQIISPETGREVAEGETGLIRIFDLANVFSVAAIQTEDLGIRRGDRFELIGRAKFSEPRGCSLMTVNG